jgi:hypothetical protein
VDIWNVDEFRAGLVVGVVGASSVVLIRLAGSILGRGRPLPSAGVVIAAGGLWSIARTGSVPTAVVVGVIGIGAVVALAAFPGFALWYSGVLTIPFAWAIGFHGDLVAVWWARALVTAAVAGGAMLAAAFDHAWQEDAPALPLFVVTAVGMYATVPDTEAVAAAVGVLLPFLVLGWPVRVATLGRPGAAAAVAMLLWAGSDGAPGRPASVIGIVVCLGLLSAPVGWLLFPGLGGTRRSEPRTGVILAMVACHVLFVVVAARAVGHISDARVAAAVGAIVAAAAVIVGALFRPPVSVGVE